MIIQQFLTNISLLAIQEGNELLEDDVPKISVAEVCVVVNAVKYNIGNVEYNSMLNEFLLEVEEEG